MNIDGLVHDEQVDYAVEHAQRVAEGVNHEIHRNTWRYSVVIEQQRKALAERRERLLTTEVAAIMLLERLAGEGQGDRRGRALPTPPGRSRCTTSTGSGPSTWPSCPRCARACTCARWAGSTRWTSSTGRRCRRSTTLVPAIEARTIETFEEIELERRTGSRTRRSSVRPSATWTYLVHDNPFGSELDRLIAAVGRRLTAASR